MAYIGLRPQRQTIATSTEKFSGNGTDLEFLLSRSVSKAADIRVFVGTEAQVPEVDYTASGTQLLFTTGNAPAAGTNNISVNYIAGALATVFLSANSFPSGSTTDPAIRFVDAVTTGMWLPTTTSLGFAVSGNTRVRVTDSPAATSTSTGALRVVGGIGASGAMYLGDVLRIEGNASATNSQTGALTVAGGVGVSGDIFVAGQLQVAGDFTVAGTFTTTGSDNLILNDPFLFLANANPGDSLDTGFVASYNDSSQRYTGLFRDITDGQYKLFDNLLSVPTTVVNTADSSFRYANLVVGNIIATNIIGSVSGGGFTSVGNLVNLSVTGTTSTIGTFYANSGLTATSVNTGAIRVPNGGGIGVTGNVHAGVQIVAPIFVGNLQATTISGTLSTAAQTNITSVGTLSSLTVSGNVGIANTNPLHTLSVTGNTNVSGNITAGNITTGTIFVNGNTTAGGWGQFSGPVTSASYFSTGGNITSTSGWGVFSDILITDSVTPIITFQATGGNVVGKESQYLRFGASGVVDIVTTSNGNLTINTGTGFTVIGNIIPNANNVSNIGRVGAVVDTVHANRLTGTLLTAAQPNITSVGSLSSLIVTTSIACDTVTASGNVGALNLNATAVKGVGGLVTASANIISTSGWGVFENARITGSGGVISWQQTGGNIIGKDGQFIRFGTQVIELYSSSNANIELNTGTGFTVVGNVIPSANNVSNIGRVGAVFNTVHANTVNSTSLIVNGNITAGNVNGVNAVAFANIGTTTTKATIQYNSSLNSIDFIFT